VLSARSIAAVALVAIVAVGASYGLTVASDPAIPKRVIELAVAAIGTALLAASIMGTMNADLARSWRPELGILPLVAVLVVALPLVSNGMPIAAAGGILAGAAGLITTVRASRAKRASQLD
jgi:hypothetical protein